jgi:hypothetical protein
MVELIGDVDVPEDKLYDYLLSREALIKKLDEMCRKVPFWGNCIEKADARIALITEKQPDVKLRVTKAFMDMLVTSVEAPRFVPPRCIAIANIPIVYHFLLASKQPEVSK